MAPAGAGLLARAYENCTLTEDGFLDESTCYVPFWSTRTGTILKWSLFLGIVVALCLYLMIGYIHAQNRIQKGLPPLSYHRFLVSRTTLARVDPHYQPPQPAGFYPYAPERHYYDMHVMPPPVYDPNAPRPPMYEPPAGSIKVNTTQQFQAGQSQHGQQSQQSHQQNEERFEYAPPPGSPPPSSSRLQDSYAPPPGPPASSMGTQATGNNNPFRD
ncbi:hypothetical protein N658DRAFT_503499 [Parathielavia hyrcaniae]|uniref:Uncharacterized protein n=1 Tax=Parathielavia hyrcaniae TaxID=113614 RepID=A0AAN6QDS7_9PEZI|nr:hypothetical protein N658DRAFT_503499 [Parathielavia hyrcaniae]